MSVAHTLDDLLPRLAPLTAHVESSARKIHNRAVAITDGNPNVSNKDQVLRQYFARALGWTSTLAKLDDRIHWQAYAAAMRGLLEASIDSLLVHGDRPPDASKRIEFWAESARLGAMNRIVNHYGPNNLPSDYQPILGYIQTETGRIKAQRIVYWQKDEHPQRWTGHGPTLESLARNLDANPVCDMGCRIVNLADTAVEDGSPLNWSVHGSGFAGLSTRDALTATCAKNLIKSAYLAVTCAAAVTHHFKIGACLYQEMADAVAALGREGYGTLAGLVPSP